jgi:hypothetical protein
MGVVIQSGTDVVFVSDTGIIWAGRTISCIARVRIRTLNMPIMLGGHALVELAKISQIQSIMACGWSHMPDLFIDFCQNRPTIFYGGSPNILNVIMLEKLVSGVLTSHDSEYDVRCLTMEMFGRNVCNNERLQLW